MHKATYNTGDSTEPDDNLDCFAQFLDIASRNTVLVTQMPFDKLQAQKQVEDSGDTNRPKEAHENGLSDLFNLMDPLVHAKDPRHTS